ncbi:MAG: phosphoribosylanthranilate isomerase [Atopobiaceae bacterium]
MSPAELARRRERAWSLVRQAKVAGAPTLIKECGMFRPADVRAANEVRPDMLGFVVDCPRSRRNVDPALLEELAPAVDERVVRVGVFVREPLRRVADLVGRGLLDLVQLHGGEDGAYLDELRGLLGGAVPVMQAFCVRGSDDVELARRSAADVVLLDAGQGSGRGFDWSLASDVGRPFALAGGLGPDNVARAVRQVHPWAVDMSSGLETNGLKDKEKMRAAVAAVRGER